MSLGNIYLILKNHFYYGMIEYPQKSGNWYKGKHEPLITKDLFDRVQEKLKQESTVKTTYGKEFAFTRLINCGNCGSTISADEKFKTLASGETARYVYYGCNRGKDHNCKAGYVREELLIYQLLKIVDQIDLNELGIKEKLNKELERFNKFRYGVLGIDPEQKRKQNEIDCKNYAKYVLKEGTISEKRELLGCMKSKLVLKDRQLLLDSNLL